MLALAGKVSGVDQGTAIVWIDRTTGSGERPPDHVSLRATTVVPRVSYCASVVVSDPSQSSPRMGRNPLEVRRTARTRSP